MTQLNSSLPGFSCPFANWIKYPHSSKIPSVCSTLNSCLRGLNDWVRIFMHINFTKACWGFFDITERLWEAKRKLSGKHFVKVSRKTVKTEYSEWYISVKYQQPSLPWWTALIFLASPAVSVPHFTLHAKSAVRAWFFLGKNHWDFHCILNRVHLAKYVGSLSWKTCCLSYLLVRLRSSGWWPTWAFSCLLHLKMLETPFQQRH